MTLVLGTASGGGSGDVVKKEEISDVDSVNSRITYYGNAEIGASLTEAVWQIYRIKETGTEIAKSWADNNALFDNIWNNRESLSYGFSEILNSWAQFATTGTNPQTWADMETGGSFESTWADLTA